MYGCTSEEVLKNHMERCKLHGAQRTKLQEADDKKGHDKIKFTKTEYQLCLPFVIYSDFESVLRKQDSCEHRHRNPSSLNTSITYHVGAASTSNAVMRNTLNHPKRNIGDDGAETFLDQVLVAATIC